MYSSGRWLGSRRRARFVQDEFCHFRQDFSERVFLLPLSATQEWGEDRGEGQIQECTRSSSPRPSPPSDGGEGAIWFRLRRPVRDAPWLVADGQLECLAPADKIG